MRTGAAFIARAALAFDLFNDEQRALYALAHAALVELEPKEGEDPDDHPDFFAWQLVKELHSRLESTEHREAMRYMLLDDLPRTLGGEPSAQPPAPPDALPA